MIEIVNIFHLILVNEVQVLQVGDKFCSLDFTAVLGYYGKVIFLLAGRDLVNTSPSLSTKIIKQEHLVRCVSITHVRVDVSQNFQLVPDDRNV